MVKLLFWVGVVWAWSADVVVPYLIVVVILFMMYAVIVIPLLNWLYMHNWIDRDPLYPDD
jgi:hypothetical protein